MSFVKDGEGKLICFGRMIITAKSRKGLILHRATTCPSSLAYSPSGAAQCGEQNLAPHPFPCQCLGTRFKAGSNLQ